MRGPETRLRKKIVVAILEAYPRAYVRKIHGNAFQVAGLPDLICCIEGHFIGLEVKIPRRKNKATPVQLLEIEKIRKAGGEAGVITSPPEALAVIREALHGR